MSEYQNFVRCRGSAVGDFRNTSTITAVVKKVVGTHYFLAIFGPLGAHFNPQPLRQPHGMTVSHIVKVNHTVVERGLEYC